MALLAWKRVGGRGGAAEGLWVFPGFVSGPIPVEISSWQGKASRGFWPVPTLLESTVSAHPALPRCPAGGGFGGLCPRHHQAVGPGAGRGQQAEGLPQSCEENDSPGTPFLLDCSFLHALLPSASADYRVTMSLS